MEELPIFSPKPPPEQSAFKVEQWCAGCVEKRNDEKE